MLIENSRFEILTETGFSDFGGIRVGYSENICIVTFSDGASIRCTLNHLIKTDKKFSPAKTLKPGIRCGNKIVVSIVLIKEPRIVYDLVNVSANSCYITNGITSHNCSFIGSSNTLIKGEKIAALPTKKPIAESPDGFVCYEAPDKKKSYVMTVDVAKGEEQDSSAFVIFDISQLPYKVVATFKNSTINTLTYPEIVHHYAQMYNEAFVLVEINSLGQQVADSLYYDIEYENMYMSIKTKKGDDIREGFSGKMRPGFETTKKTKMIGCNAIKLIVEQDNIEVNSLDIISEMSTFVRSGSSWKAEEGKHDDLMMCMVTFGFLTQTTAFKNLFDYSLRKEFIKTQLSQIQSEELPIGFFVDGREQEDLPFPINF